MDTAREIVKALSPSPRIDAPRVRTRRLNLQRASRRLQTNGVWWKRTTSKKKQKKTTAVRSASGKKRKTKKQATPESSDDEDETSSRLVCGEPCM